eukprot:TRINITY_DN48705_c0_g1_i1.p1 TRINITY_DN48705_c0_g1~~TRINITY_DN48705_c0_g1_i1.p1  ORF type:complete len:601 (-),score=109.96 TRINITY_DN48705_c0_g1_i1:488-2290(-)
MAFQLKMWLPKGSVMVMLLLSSMILAEALPKEKKLEAVRITASTEEGTVAGQINGTVYMKKCGPLSVLPFIPEPASPPNVAAFLGVPFAAAPTDDRRFRPPQPAFRRKSVFEAMKPGNVCPQLPGADLIKVPQLPTHEDCLFLNIWSPTAADGSFRKGLPVMVFFHGGGYISGDGYEETGCPLYNAQGISADTDMIVVSANYRVGLLGFLAHPELLKESGTTGNYGLQDQRAALEWVNRNIASFGGDPGRVTIAGESAGATSVLHHLASSRSQHLFSQAISMSSYGRMWPLDKAYALGDEFLSKIDCDKFSSPLQCLRNVPHEKLLSAQAKVVLSNEVDIAARLFTFGPVSDGFELPLNTSLEVALEKTRPSKPLLIGTTRNETNLWECMMKIPDSMSWPQANEWLRRKFSEVLMPNTHFTEQDMDEYLNFYKGFPSPKAGLMAASTDAQFTCWSRRVAQLVSETGAPVFRYLFSHTPGVFNFEKCLGTPHTAGLWLLFSGAFPQAVRRFLYGGAVGEEIATEMTSAWGRFVHGDDPPSKGWTAWSDAEPLLQFGNEAQNGGATGTLQKYQEDSCNVLERLLSKDSDVATSEVAASEVVV